MREHTVGLMNNSLMPSAAPGQSSLSSSLLSTPATAAVNKVDFPLLNMLALGALNNMCLNYGGSFSGKMDPEMQAEDRLCRERPSDIEGVWDSEYDDEYPVDERRDAAWADAGKKAVEEWHQKHKEDLQAIEMCLQLCRSRCRQTCARGFDTRSSCWLVAVMEGKSQETKAAVDLFRDNSKHNSS